MKKKYRKERQFAVLPWRLAENGERQVLLLTSRDTGRWVIPKGWPMKGRKPAEAAAREAYEEVGLVGEVLGQHAIGSFHYEKQAGDTAFLCQVSVFLFRVERQLEDWPERAQRTVEWFGVTEASKLVDEGGLAEIIRHFANSRLSSVVGLPTRRARRAVEPVKLI
jgi:8-oxo-dGTP pyrophosphatase MutT (NUDIX family)